jgi:dolichol-phosphate mannosyltransferase
MKPLISIIAPMFNESGLVAIYCEETKAIMSTIEEKYDYEIILVNDGSSDDTLDEMSLEHGKDKKHVAIVNLSRNFGLEGAVNAGLKVASGDAVVVMDADLQDPPKVIPNLVSEWERGADVVTAVRTSRTSDLFFKKAGANLFYRALDHLSGRVKIRRGAANFRLLSKKALEIYNSLPEVNSVFRVTVPFIGLKSAYVGYDRDPRYAGESKYRLKNMIPYALDSLTGMSVEPLRKIRASIYLSVLVCIVSIVLSILCRDHWQIAFVILSVISLLFLILFVCISIIGEYIAQIMIEVKRRPISIISNYKASANSRRNEEK